jgi:hypothetical protein
MFTEEIFIQASGLVALTDMNMTVKQGNFPPQRKIV